MAEKRPTTKTKLASSSSSSPIQSEPRCQPPRNSYLRKNSRPIDNSINNSTRNLSSKKKNENTNIDKEIDLPSLIGTCPFMCPVEERLQRERLRDLAVFERFNGNPGKSSPHLAVKRFCRTISTREVQASDVRPLSVLEETLDYVFGLFASREYPFEVIHDFTFDRTRSVRQDLSMQNAHNKKAISMYERMVKFHVISHHKLRKCSLPNIASILHLNLEQLTKSLMTLFNLYETNRSTHSINENEAEFCSLYVLLHVHPDNQGESLSLWFRRVPSTIMKSKEMCFARRILRYSRLGNYNRFMYTLETEASYLQYCVIEPYIDEVRAFAICCLNNGGYKLQPLQLSNLSKLLVFEGSDVESFCIDCGLQTTSDEVGNLYLPTKQTSFCHPKTGFQKYYHFNSERLQRTLGELWPQLSLGIEGYERRQRLLHEHTNQTFA